MERKRSIGTNNQLCVRKNIRSSLNNNKYSLLAKLLSKKTKNIMSYSFNSIKKYSQYKEKILKRMASIYTKFQYLQTKEGLQQLKLYKCNQILNEKMIRDALNVIGRFCKQQKRKYFRRIHQYGQQCIYSYNRGLEKAIQGKFAIFHNKIHRIIKRKIKDHFQHMIKFCQRKNQSIITFQKIVDKIFKNKLSSHFQSILLYQPQIDQDDLKKQQEEQLQRELQNMSMRLQQKTANIQHLNQQLLSVQAEYEEKSRLQLQSKKNYNSLNILKSIQRQGSLASLGSDNRSQLSYNSGRDSIDSKSSFSLKKYLKVKNGFTMMNDSFFSFKSKGSKASRGSRGSKASLGYGKEKGQGNDDCNCLFKYKYKQYYSLHGTLQKQIAIIKKQLQIAKALNDYFQNQLRVYGGRPDEEDQIDKVKQRLQQTNKQRDQLKAKLNSNVHKIAEIKEQFKNKMQKIYRQVKKQQY